MYFIISQYNVPCHIRDYIRKIGEFIENANGGFKLLCHLKGWRFFVVKWKYLVVERVF